MEFTIDERRLSPDNPLIKKLVNNISQIEDGN
jgi:hypothetical protein